MARIKPSVIIIGDVQELESVLAEMAEIDRSISVIENEMNKEIDRAKEIASVKSKSFLEKRKEFANAIAVYATIHKDELFQDKKSAEFNFGIIGYRQSTAIVQMAKNKVEDTIKKIKEFGLNVALRTKEEIDKTKLVDWSNEKLASIGMQRKVEDTFFIEVKQESVK